MALSGHFRCLLLRGANTKNINFLELRLYFLRFHRLPIEGVLTLHIQITIRVYDNCPPQIHNRRREKGGRGGGTAMLGLQKGKGDYMTKQAENKITALYCRL